MLTYSDEDGAVRIAKATDYGLQASESALDQPGGTAMRRHLAHVLFLHTLRIVYRTGRGGPGRDWLAALADPLIGRALHAVHAAPERNPRR